MRIKIQENAINIDDLKQKLVERFSGKYDISNRDKNILVVAESKTIGALVIPLKKSIAINGNFPTMKGQMIFTILMVALGILIPLIVYFAVYHKKMKAVETEVAEFIKSYYKDKLIIS